MDRLWLLVFLGGFVITGVQPIWGIDISTTSEVEAVNGTSVKLKCTFSSTEPVSLQTVTVTWDFQSITSKTSERIFYYQEIPYPPGQAPFKGHVEWSGDIMRKDASITLNNVRPTFNGTYFCHVANPPDVHGNVGETILRVVNKVTLSEISLLAAVVGGSCAVILVSLGIFIAVRMYRKRNKEKDIEMRLEEYRNKDPTVCSPADAVHLTALKTKKEAVSSDDEESESSSGDDEEEEGLGDEDDDDDDDEDDLGDDDDD